MNPISQTRYIAAIDLGSNSFHMVVAKIVGQELQLVSRHKQNVQLANGLNEQGELDNAAIERGLDCLAMFAERIQGFKQADVRIAATHTLRQAINADEFIQRARRILPYPIEIISGAEEARLIYQGVSHTQSQSDRKLIVDIGGGSTEIIYGSGFEPELLNSKPIGCITVTQQFFANGKLSHTNFTNAILAAEQKLESLAHHYRLKGWSSAFGSSGTVKAIRDVLCGLGYQDGVITAKRLLQLIALLSEKGNINDIELTGLTDARKPVFAAGIAIMYAVFVGLKIREMFYTEGALREGLLYEMEARLKRSDIRMRTTENLAIKHLVDLEHAARVKGQAREFLQQIHEPLAIKQHSELFDLLEWSALLHEVGLSISLSDYHRHSAYLLQHSNMPGFNIEQQRVLATLARFQRKSMNLNEIENFSLYQKPQLLSLIRVLRLAILLNSQRSDSPLPPFELTITTQDQWQLSCSEFNWLTRHKLLNANLLAEQAYWHQLGWQLEIH
ncbi:exopolyphosphatase [Vibrio scophthalmi]|uniref:exopolyphosphatase n=1 Tax=Vibrio scophthalmi TaxID=45658 RepID=UPI003AADF948